MNKQIKPTVYRILLGEREARQSDNYLIFRVVQELEPELAGTNFANVMFNLGYKKISLEGITRARRKFFEEYPQLKEENVENARRIEEENYIVEYSKRGSLL